MSLAPWPILNSRCPLDGVQRFGERVYRYTRALCSTHTLQAQRTRHCHRDSVESRLDPSRGVQCTERLHPGELAV